MASNYEGRKERKDGRKGNEGRHGRRERERGRVMRRKDGRIIVQDERGGENRYLIL
jgi:hypothetical protein